MQDGYVTAIRGPAGRMTGPLVVFQLALAAVAVGGEGYDLSWNTMDGGGGTSTGGGFTLSGTIGQADGRSQPMTGSDFTLVGGFWVSLAAERSCDPDYDGDGDVDGKDFVTFAVCFNGSNNPPDCGL